MCGWDNYLTVCTRQHLIDFLFNAHVFKKILKTVVKISKTSQKLTLLRNIIYQRFLTLFIFYPFLEG